MVLPISWTFGLSYFFAGLSGKVVAKMELSYVGTGIDVSKVGSYNFVSNCMLENE